MPKQLCCDFGDSFTLSRAAAATGEISRQQRRKRRIECLIALIDWLIFVG
jgi:hypothetical protein